MPISFFLISSLQSPDLSIKFLIFLAFSKESDLGFDPEIKRVDHSDFELRFLVQGVEYSASKVLYDLGAEVMCGRGTRVFEAHPHGHVNPTPRVIKDCWVENRVGKEMEHIIVEKVNAAIGPDKFCEYFVDVYGYHKVENQALDRFCSILFNEQFDVRRSTHTLSWDGEANPQRRPNPRFRYQIVCTERGTSLYDITSLSETFGYLIQVMDGTKLVIVV